MRRRLMTLTIVSAFALGACGIKGDLNTPPPLWGESKTPSADTEAPEKTDDNYFESDDFFEDDDF